MSNYPDGFTAREYDRHWGAGPVSNAAVVQAASARAMWIALRDCAQIISGLEFPLGCPVEGYDVADIVNSIAVEFMPRGNG